MNSNKSRFQMSLCNVPRLPEDERRHNTRAQHIFSTERVSGLLARPKRPAHLAGYKGADSKLASDSISVLCSFATPGVAQEFRIDLYHGSRRFCASLATVTLPYSRHALMRLPRSPGINSIDRLSSGVYSLFTCTPSLKAQLVKLVNILRLTLMRHLQISWRTPSSGSSQMKGRRPDRLFFIILRWKYTILNAFFIGLVN
ncbi:expressed protein [Echinococcus multilocularis]|uniref:Expressed protein n=1 Tax=Echinococcus multilocularis TaxID=6211 RepID=A0A068Y6L7_ECHMU|nr:expressed protein [Echinococcus multilocularis]